MSLQVLDTAGEHAHMGGGAVVGRAGYHKVRLEPHGCAAGNHLRHVRRLHQRDRHTVCVVAEYLIDSGHIASLLSGRCDATDDAIVDDVRNDDIQKIRRRLRPDDAAHAEEVVE